MGGEDERGDLFFLSLSGSCLTVRRRPCLRGKPFSSPAHYCVLYSAVLGGTGHCSALQSCQASFEGFCVMCVWVGVGEGWLVVGGECAKSSQGR